MQTSNNPVPVVDFSAFITGNARDQARVAAEIGRACRQVGFFYLSHHGVDEALLRSVFEASARSSRWPDGSTVTTHARSAPQRSTMSRPKDT